MGTEADFDDLVGPALRSIADHCGNLDMSLIARVEWQPNHANLMIRMPEWKPGGAQRLTQLMAQADGDIDGFLTEVCKRFDTSNSHYLRQFMLQPAHPKARTGETRRKALAAIRVALKKAMDATPAVDPQDRAHAISVDILTALEEAEG